MIPSDPLPTATLKPAPGERVWRVRPKHVVAAFALLSIGGMLRSLFELTLWYPPLGVFFDILWLTPLIVPFARKRMTTFWALACLGAFVGQALVFEVYEALPRIFELRLPHVATTIGILLGLVASVVNIAKPDPDPDFMPNEFTIR